MSFKSLVPEIVDLEKFNKYMMEVFKPAVLEFNGACGKAPELVEDVEIAVDMVLNECKRVIEECKETISAYEDNDRTERLDGIVDVYWTQIQLSNLLTVFKSKFGEEFDEEMQSRAYDDILLQQYAFGLIPLAIQLGTGTIISGKSILHGAERIIINNRMKYTTSCEEAKDWEQHIDKTTQAIRHYEYNGVQYYCIKRLSDDYIVKPYNFKPVNLGGL